MTRTDDEIMGLSFCIIAVSCVYVAVCVYLFLGVQWTPGMFQSMGFMAVLGASLIFSTTTIPYKMPALSNLNIDPLIFTICQAAGIAGVSLPLLLFLSIGGKLKITPFGALGSSFFTVVAYTSVHAVKRVGISVGPGTWSGVGMITSFTIGLALFREKVKVILAAGFAILLLVIGVFCVSTSKGAGGASESCQREMTKDSSPRVEDGDDDYEGLPMQVVPVVEAKGKGGIPKAATLPSALPWSGLAFCIITGLFDGCLMVPYKLYASSSAVALHTATDKIYSGLNYLVSFAVGALVCMPALCFPIIIYNQRQQYRMHQSSKGEKEEESPPSLREAFLVALPAGASSGALWALANILSVLGTATISMSISFPLTQTCMLWATAIGTFYFNEHIERRARLGVGVVITLAGAYFLAASK